MTDPAPLATFSANARRAIRGVFTDIDDTLTTWGELTGAAYLALERLRKAGFIVVPITGRCAGWCDHFARMWPVDAVVGENGAFYFRYDRKANRLQKRFLDDAATRARKREKLHKIGQQILRDVAGSALASDQAYQESALAIDWGEDLPALPAAALDRIIAIMHKHGMNAKVSSIHVNGWFGDYDKLSMTKTLMREVFAVDLDAQREQFVFIGDSPNDAPMFAHFPHAVGVANVRDFKERIVTMPRYITKGAAGAGFIELADALIATKLAKV